MKFLVITGSFIAGAIIDDAKRIVVTADPGLKHLVGCSEKDFRKHCQEHKWAFQEVK